MHLMKTIQKRWCPIQILLASRLLELVVMDIFETLLKTLRGNHFVAMIGLLLEAGGPGQSIVDHSSQSIFGWRIASYSMVFRHTSEWISECRSWEDLPKTFTSTWDWAFDENLVPHIIGHVPNYIRKAMIFRSRYLLPDNYKNCIRYLKAQKYAYSSKVHCFANSGPFLGASLISPWSHESQSCIISTNFGQKHTIFASTKRKMAILLGHKAIENR